MVAGGAVTAPSTVTTFAFAALQPSELCQVVLKQQTSTLPQKAASF